jgi:hypothetical protein
MGTSVSEENFSSIIYPKIEGTVFVETPVPAYNFSYYTKRQQITGNYSWLIIQSSVVSNTVDRNTHLDARNTSSLTLAFWEIF